MLVERSNLTHSQLQAAQVSVQEAAQQQQAAAPTAQDSAPCYPCSPKRDKLRTPGWPGPSDRTAQTSLPLTHRCSVQG
eukprot:1161273-Pelagomonas_calceolata.AAC.3